MPNDLPQPPAAHPARLRDKAGQLGSRVNALLPGLALCIAVSVAAEALQAVEQRAFGQAWLEALVLAILIGTAVRTAWTPSKRWYPGMQFSAKTLLEVAVMLLGASLDSRTIVAAGPGLILGVGGVVVLALSISYGIGRVLGLSHHMATLVACGNSICGNSAIAATAPVIGADADDIAASIAFTAVLGVLVVLCLPLLIPVIGLSDMQYGVLAGLTVYAVPQVLAATAPVAAVSVTIGTLVKLVRVLMLGPVILGLSMVVRAANARDEASLVTDGPVRASHHLPFHKLVPWFIIGFLALAALRSLGLFPEALLAPTQRLATILTVLSMAALGLGVDVRMVARAGLRVTMAVTLSLVVLGVIAVGLIRLLGIA